MTVYSTDLTHFLTEKGGFHIDLPVEARQLAEFLCNIVAAVTSGEYTKFPETIVTCMQKKRGKVCDGVICAGFDGDTADTKIRWHCVKCNTSGVIQGWEGTAWDLLEYFLDDGAVH